MKKGSWIGKGRFGHNSKTRSGLGLTIDLQGEGSAIFEDGFNSKLGK